MANLPFLNKIAKSKDELFSDSREGDIVVPVMGPTGVGKSTFINNYLNENKAKVGHDLASCTASLQPFYIPLSNDFEPYKRLVLVDTPGFDDTNEADSEILRRIAVWLASSYGKGKTCGGLIYLHDITDARMRGTTLQNLQVFKKLCGKKNLGSVVFATTKSGSLTPQAFARREGQLRDDYWNECMKQGARVFKLLPSHASAQDLVKVVLEKAKEDGRILVIQKELTKLQRIIPMTDAGRKLKYTLDEIMEHQRKVLEGGDISNTEAAEAQAKVAAVGEQLKSLTLPLTTRILMFFGLA